MVVFEVYLVPGADAADILSEETRRETQAKILTHEEAVRVGFVGLPEPEDREMRIIAVSHRYLSWIHRALEMSAAVHKFRVHELDT